LRHISAFPRAALVIMALGGSYPAAQRLAQRVSLSCFPS